MGGIGPAVRPGAKADQEKGPEQGNPGREAGVPRERQGPWGGASRHGPASAQAPGGGSGHHPSCPQREHPQPQPAVMWASLCGSQWRAPAVMSPYSLGKQCAVPRLYLRSRMFDRHLFSLSAILCSDSVPESTGGGPRGRWGGRPPAGQQVRLGTCSGHCVSVTTSPPGPKLQCEAPIMISSLSHGTSVRRRRRPDCNPGPHMTLCIKKRNSGKLGFPRSVDSSPRQ